MKGFGKTDYYSKGSDELLKVALKIMSNQNCNIYGSEKVLDSSQICAGDGTGGVKDTCMVMTWNYFKIIKST